MISKNPAAKQMGVLLLNAQNKFENNEINSLEHRVQCNEILEAAEILNGSSDVDNALMSQLELKAFSPHQHALTNEEYLIICDDLKVQLHPDEGIEATRGRPLQNATAAVSPRGYVVARQLRAALQTIASSIRTPPPPHTRALQAVRRGQPLSQVLSNFDTMSQADTEDVRRAYEEFRSTGRMHLRLRSARRDIDS